MDCRETEESILESLEGPLGAERRLAMEDHIAGCGGCRSFAEVQRTLDVRLAAAIPDARLSAGFQSTVKARIRRDPVSPWPDFLPELAHLAGCLVATGASVFLLPLPAGTVILAGAAFTAFTYLLQTEVQATLEQLEGDV